MINLVRRGQSSVYGQVSDIKLLGNTIFNYADNGNNYSKWTVDSGSSKSSNGISLVGKGGTEYAGLPIQLRPSTQYTIVYNVTAKTSSGIFAIAVDLISGMYDKEITSNIGINKAKITTKDTITNDNLRFKIAGGNDGDYINFQVWAILEGDWTNRELPFSGEIGYGTKSTINVRLVSQSKNLCPLNVDNWERGTILTSNGSLSAATNRLRTKKFYPVFSNKQTAFSVNDGYLAYVVYFYDADYKYISSNSAMSTLNSVVTPINAKYFKLVVAKANQSLDILPTDINNAKPQAEYGDTRTSFEPDKKESTAYVSWGASGEGRSVGSVKDEVSVVTGVKTQNVSDDYVVNGDLNFESYYDTGNCYSYAARLIFDSTIETIAGGDFIEKNDDLPYQKLALTSDNARGIRFISSTSIRITIEKAKVDLMGGAGVLVKFKIYLNTHPITLTYQLAEPITTYIDPQPLQIFPSGSRWVEHANKEVAIYNTGIHVANTDLPIEEMIKVEKIGLQNGRWYREPIDLADVTVASDGLSFTIDGATSGDFEQYEFVYYYDSALSTLPELVIPDEPSLVTIKNSNISL